MRYTLMCMVMVMAGCGDDALGGSHVDAGIDGAIDEGVPIGSYCTTAACAANPCTAGCTLKYENSACPANMTTVSSPAAFAMCAGYCAVVANEQGPFTQMGFCYYYDGSRPGCSDPVCHYDPSCVVETNSFSADESVICPANYACYNGLPVEDMAPDCSDMSMRD